MKSWYVSKTLWLNLVFLVVFIIQAYNGFVIDLEVQAAILVVVNMLLRFITKDEIDW